MDFSRRDKKKLIEEADCLNRLCKLDEMENILFYETAKRMDAIGNKHGI